MFVVVYLKEPEYLKFLAGKRCEGYLSPAWRDMLYQAVVPREQVKASFKPGAMGLGRTLMAEIEGSGEAE